MNTANILLQTLLEEFFKEKRKIQGSLSVSAIVQSKSRAMRKVLDEIHIRTHVLDKESDGVISQI